MNKLEKIIAALGGFAGIFSILSVTEAMFGKASEVPLIVASMGASAVLLFAVPHGQLSQPWPLIGGHVLSAIIGVTCALLVGNNIFAAALAVGLAIGVMHYARCIHPPGGATALAAVTGGPQISALGYGYVLAPVLLNALVILAIGIAFNALFKWRKYPLCWVCKSKTA